MEGLIEGREVHFVMPDGQHRPATIVHVWSQNSGCSNLQVQTDGWNDTPEVYTTTAEKEKAAQGLRNFGINVDEVKHGHFLKTSALNDETNKLPGTWHWIERV